MVTSLTKIAQSQKETAVGTGVFVAGTAVAVAMTGVFVTAIALSILKSLAFLFMVGFFSYYFVVRGYRQLYLKGLGRTQKAAAIDWFITGIALLFGGTAVIVATFFGERSNAACNQSSEAAKNVNNQNSCCEGLHGRFVFTKMSLP